MSVKIEWEYIEEANGIAHTERAKVHGGWLVKRTLDVLVSLHEEQTKQEGYEWRESLCFVPDPNHEWV